MRLKKSYQKVLCVILALMMLVSMFPVSAADTYTVTFYLADGSSEVIEVPIGSAIGNNMPPKQEIPGREVIGWIDVITKEPVTAETVPTGNMEVAIHLATTYTVTFYLADGSAEVVEVPIGSAIGDNMLPKQEIPGREVIGWIDVITKEPVTAETVPTGNMEVAIHLATTYTVTFYLADGTPKVVEVPIGSAIGEANMPPKQEIPGKVVIGWIDVITKEAVTAETVPTGNMDVAINHVAAPTPVTPVTPVYGYPIDVNTVEGGYVLTDSYAYAGDTVLISVMTDAGYELVNLTVADGSVLYPVYNRNGVYSFTMPTAAVTITATFEKALAANTYSDVLGGTYYYDAVRWALGNGVLVNTSGKFEPDAVCTRAQIIEFMWRAAGSPTPWGEVSFTDVPKNASYAQAVQWAVENGITTGTTATTFSPNEPVTRAQAMTFLWRYADEPRLMGASFKDVSADAYYAYAVKWAVQASITTGTTTTTFSPDEGCTRAQIITFLYRWFGK